MKNYTDIEQSKKLAEFLPLESADNYYSWHDERYYIVNKDCPYPYSLKEKIPCWSLAALLSVLPKIINNETLFIETSAALWHIGYRNIYTARADNLVDACIAIIEKIHEINLL